jgi:hypothetical protein
MAKARVLAAATVSVRAFSVSHMAVVESTASVSAQVLVVSSWDVLDRPVPMESVLARAVCVTFGCFGP